jgi:hypothetical protein
VLAVSSSRSKQSTWWLIDIGKRKKKEKKGRCIADL